MRYALIDIDGSLEIRTGAWDAQLGPEGPARVSLLSRFPIAGWVNDCGLLDQRTYPRNIVGSCLLCCLGAAPQPYAGPAVIAGWHPSGCPCGREPTEFGLPPLWVTYLRQLHADVRLVLEGLNPSDPSLPASWGLAVRTFADHVRTAPTPVICFVSGGAFTNPGMWGPN